MSTVKHIDISPQLITKRTRKSRAKSSSTTPRIRVKAGKTTTRKQTDDDDSVVVQKRDDATENPKPKTDDDVDEFSAAIQYLNELSKHKTQQKLGVRPPSFTRSNTTRNAHAAANTSFNFKLPARPTIHSEQPTTPPRPAIKIKPPPPPPPPPPPIPVPLPMESDIQPVSAPAYQVDGAIPYSSLVNGIKPSYRKYTQKIRPVPRVHIPPTCHVHTPAPTALGNIRRVRKTIRQKYHVGKSNKHHKVGVLIKNAVTQKRNRDAQDSLRSVSMTDIRAYLRSHNLIRADSTAPDHILKQMFESAMLAGDINNTNSGIVVHNALAEIKPLMDAYALSDTDKG